MIDFRDCVCGSAKEFRTKTTSLTIALISFEERRVGNLRVFIRPCATRDESSSYVTNRQSLSLIGRLSLVKLHTSGLQKFNCVTS